MSGEQVLDRCGGVVFGCEVVVVLGGKRGTGWFWFWGLTKRLTRFI